MQIRRSATLLARPIFGGLWSQNCIMEVHVLLKGMSLRFMFLDRVYVFGGHALKQAMLHFVASAFVWWTCLVGVIGKLVVFHGLACVFPCWILLEAIMYVLVAFLLTYLY